MYQMLMLNDNYIMVFAIVCFSMSQIFRKYIFTMTHEFIGERRGKILLDASEANDSYDKGVFSQDFGRRYCFNVGFRPYQKLQIRSRDINGSSLLLYDSKNVLNTFIVSDRSFQFEVTSLNISKHL